MTHKKSDIFPHKQIDKEIYQYLCQCDVRHRITELICHNHRTTEKECEKKIEDAEKKVEKILADGEKKFDTLQAAYKSEYAKWKQLRIQNAVLEANKQESCEGIENGQ